MSQNKIALGAILIALMASSLLAIQVNAQTTTPSMKTYPIIEAIPNPIGVGQETLIRTGILQQLGSVDYGWTGVTVTVVRPDNTTETLGPFTTDSTGSTYTIYVPTQVGTYQLTTNFPEQKSPITFFNNEGGNTILANTTMLASTSETIDLVVQEQPLPSYPGHILPTDYWSRPIDPQLREWYSISGNWVSRPDNSIALYNDNAPETAHTLWALPLTTGGLTGGLWGDGQVPASSETGDAYEGKFPNSVILNGVLYYQRTDTRAETAPAIIAVDLHTGEQWLFKNNTVLSFGQVLYFNSYNYDGVYTYIWSVAGSGNNYTYTAYDPFTGNQQMQITDVPSGIRTFGPSGEILIYQMDYNAGWMALWNSTDCGLQNAVIGTPSYGSWGNTAHGTALGPGLNGTNPRSYTWNTTIPLGLSVISSIGGPAVKVYSDRVVGMYFNQTIVRVWALSTQGTSRGQLIFDKTWAAPSEWQEGQNTLHYTGATNELQNGVMAVWNKEQRVHYGFSTETGDYLWQTQSEHYADAYGWGNAEHTWYFAYNNLYSVGVAGIVYCYDGATGNTLWTYNMTDSYNEPVTGENWWGWIDVISNGKIYIGTLEHSAEQPLPRGGPYICLNATDGSEIWRVNGMYRSTRWGGNSVMGDSIIATMDTYDQQVYAIGKGPSAITVDAPNVGVQLGNSLIIRGTVTDTSPGTQGYSMTARFPNGVPAVADQFMSDWMLYVYKQFELPSNVTGVPVALDVIDANGNLRNIGVTTSDANGFYSFQWTPDIPGNYTLTATFSGSNAYYGSSAKTSFGVQEAVSETVSTQTTSNTPTELYFAISTIAIIIAIAIVGALIVMMLRKRP